MPPLCFVRFGVVKIAKVERTLQHASDGRAACNILAKFLGAPVFMMDFHEISCLAG
jgi:hypothetical protein